MAFERAAEDPNPAAENSPLLTSILSEGPSYLNTSSRICEMCGCLAESNGSPSRVHLSDSSILTSTPLSMATATAGWP